MFTERRTSLTKRSLQGILCLFTVTYMVLLATIYMVFFISANIFEAIKTIFIVNDS